MHNPEAGYINTNSKSNLVWMHSLKTAFYLSYFGKDATWNKNIKYIFKQKKCNKL